MTTAQAAGLPERWDAVLEHRERAVRVARARLSDPFDVDDCVQEGLARVVAMPNLDLGRVGPLLSTVVANVAADTHRERARSSRLITKVSCSDIPAQVHDEPVCDAAEARWLAQQLGSLTERDRAVLELRAQGQTVAQTAAALGMTYKAVESAFTRARNALKGIWRATLVFVALVLRRSWRSEQPTFTASVLVVATLGVIAWQVGDAGDRAGPYRPGASVLSQAPPPVVGAALAPYASGRLARQATASPASTSHPVADSSRITSVNPPTVGFVRPGRSRITKEHGDESLVATVQRCIRRGVNPDPFNFSCRD
jgi:RNA polymerase sigma factor (sigma-70 family)